MPKKFASGDRYALVELEAGVAERNADRLRLDDPAKFAADRLGRLGGDQLETVEQRQARLDAAHDHVDGVGQGVEKTRLAPFLEKPQEPKRQTASGRKGKRERGQQAGAGRQRDQECEECRARLRSR